MESEKTKVPSLCDVAVVIPAYNEEQVIQSTIARVRGTSSEWRIVVIDDGSEDKPRTSNDQRFLDLIGAGLDKLLRVEFYAKRGAVLDSVPHVYGGVKVQRVAAQKCGTC